MSASPSLLEKGGVGMDGIKKEFVELYKAFSSSADNAGTTERKIEELTSELSSLREQESSNARAVDEVEEALFDKIYGMLTNNPYEARRPLRTQPRVDSNTGGSCFCCLANEFVADRLGVVLQNSKRRLVADKSGPSWRAPCRKSLYWYRGSAFRRFL